MEKKTFVQCDNCFKIFPIEELKHCDHCGKCFCEACAHRIGICECAGDLTYFD